MPALFCSQLPFTPSQLYQKVQGSSSHVMLWESSFTCVLAVLREKATPPHKGRADLVRELEQSRGKFSLGHAAEALCWSGTSLEG